MAESLSGGVVEILAPAGNMDTLIAVLKAGADAVYIGGKNFSARSSAVNFTEEEIRKSADICHRYGSRLYLAVNTIISDREISEFCEYVKNVARAGADAFIVQDWGAVHIIRQAVPDAVVHASTQMSVHTVTGCGFLGDMGFARVIPARELDRGVIEKICGLDIESEFFVHGALCRSVSGQCYISAFMGSRSANRGCCGQACRLDFRCGGRSSNVLSLKDLSLIPNARELANMGADSLKIEGRLKREEYAVSAVHELKKSLTGRKPDMKILENIFSRDGFTDGYFTGNMKNMHGFRTRENAVSAQQVLPVIHEFYRTERQVHGVKFDVKIKKGEEIFVTAESEGVRVQSRGGVPETAQKSVADRGSVEKQLSKLGGTVFFAESFDFDIDDGLFVSSGQLNRIRRELAEKLEREIVRKNTPVYTVTDFVPDRENLPEKKGSPKKKTLRTFCRNNEQAEISLDFSEYIILGNGVDRDSDFIIKNIDRVIISPERFISNEDALISELYRLRERGFSRLFCHTLDTVAIGKKLGFTLHGSFTLNAFNSYSLDYLKKTGLSDCVFSVEAKLSQYAEIRTDMEVGAVVAGRVPVMLTKICPVKDQGACTGRDCEITDTTGRKFPLICDSGAVEIFNCDYLYMLDRLDLIKNIDFGLVILTDETPEQVEKIFHGEKPDGVRTTRGLYYRGLQEML